MCRAEPASQEIRKLKGTTYLDIFHPALTPFSVALLIMAGLAALELLGLLVGTGFSSLFDSISPDVDLEIDLDLDADLDGPDMPELDGAGPIAHFLSWLSVGKVPILVLLVAFLTSFGLIGLIGQHIIQSTLGFYLHGALAAVGALFLALPATRHLGLAIARIMPKEETDAVSRNTFVGKVATIIRGEAKFGAPAEAKLKDNLGKVHYVLIEPDNKEDRFTQGDEVILVEQAGAVYRAIANTNAALSST